MKEKFLVLEIRPGGTDGLYLAVDEDRNITIEKFEEGKPLGKFVSSPARMIAQKSWEGRHVFSSRRRVIAAAGPEFATTIPVPLSLMRDRANANTKITIVELENLIAQAMAKVFNGCRTEAAKRMGVDELDAVLVGASAGHFKIDGNSHRDPAGFRGKAISLVMEFTFAARRVFEALAPFFASPDGFYFAEAPQAHLRALSRVRKLPICLISADARGPAFLYLYMQPKGEYEVLYREPFKWSPGGFIRAISEAFAVGEPAARDLYGLYCRGELSPSAANTFKKTLEPEISSFLGELSRDKVQGTVYLDLAHPLPVLPASALPRAAKNIEKHPVGELLTGLGFTLSKAGAYRSVMRSERHREVLRPLLYFIEAYFDRSDLPINRKLRRRLHWLAD